MSTWTNEKSRKDKKGKCWNFSFWFAQSRERGVWAQRLFFWDDNKNECGVVLFLPGSTRRYSRTKTLIERLVASPALRKQYLRSLSFPLKRHYSEFGAFPEENSSQKRGTG